MNFLLVINGNFCLILHRFRDIAGFLLKRATSPLFHPNFGVFPLDSADVEAPRSEDPKLIIHVVAFKLTQLIRPRYLNVTDGETDGQTDGRTDDLL